ncbi:MAG: GerMN domain-containing protein [Candidatus Levybacteria bacterium]|nr:GerMN domain-containing protein [Candidatus Levybacteria bacterium]
MVSNRLILVLLLGIVLVFGVVLGRISNTGQNVVPVPVISTAPTTSSPSLQPSPTPSPVIVNKVNVYMIALEDNGKSGEKIGCGDSVIAVERSISSTTMPLRAALEQLLSIKDRTLGQFGLYNSLYQSDLKVDRVSIDNNGKATVNLSGKVQLGGVCDNPRFEAQITKTVLQFSTIKTVAVFINSVPLKDIVSEK